MNGIVIADNKCDTNVIPAATDVSFPYPPGITIVLNPNGIANAQIVQTTIFFEIGT